VLRAAEVAERRVLRGIDEDKKAYKSLGRCDEGEFEFLRN